MHAKHYKKVVPLQKKFLTLINLKKVNIMCKIKRFTVLFFAVVAMPLSFWGQKTEHNNFPDMPIDEDTKLVTYKEVIPEKGSPDELFDRGLAWVQSYYKNTNEVIKLRDKLDGVIKARSSVKIYSILKDGSKLQKNVVYYNLKLEFRQDRYRYTITDFNEKATAAAPIEAWFNTKNVRWEPSWYEWLNQIDEQIQELIKSLQEGMEPKVEKKDEW